VLRFRLGSFPVSVYPSFLLAAALLGYVWMDAWQTLLLWIGVVFVSVLVHELGHAVVALAFGGRPEIRLEGFGGVTFPRLPQPPSAWKQIVLSVAGPVAGRAWGWPPGRWGACWRPSPARRPPPFCCSFQVTSIDWAILNLLPVLPLDGGHGCRPSSRREAQAEPSPGELGFRGGGRLHRAGGVADLGPAVRRHLVRAVRLPERDPRPARRAGGRRAARSRLAAAARRRAG